MIKYYFCDLFSIKLSFLIKAMRIDIIKIKYVVFPVVKKLPVLLMGNISAKNKKINGTIKLLFSRLF